MKITLRSVVVACGLILAALQGARAAEIQRVVSPGGIEAWLIADDAVPILSFSFGFKGGTSLDPVGKEGVARLASSMLDEGAGDLDSAAFQQRLADLGIDFGFDADNDSFTGEMRVLTAHAGEAADLLALALTSPRFDAEPLERMRRHWLISIESESRSPDELAGRALNRAMFGSDPYARPDNGMAETMSALTADDLRAFVKARFSRDRFFVAVAGDTDAATLGPLLDRAFGGLPKAGPADQLGDVTPAATGRLLLLQRDIPQAAVYFAQPGLKRDDPDFFAAYLMNYTLGGGGFSSRLMYELREKRGLTYGVNVDLVTLDRAGIIAGGFETGNDKVAETIEILRDEWRHMAAEGPTEAELEAAKQYLLGYYPRNLTTTTRAANTLLGIQMTGLGIDYMERRRQEIAGVTIADVRRVAQRLLNEKALTIVVAGKPAGLEEAEPVQLP